VPTTAEATLAEYLAAFNDADPQAIEAFARDRTTLRQASASWPVQRRSAGPLTLISSEAAGDHAVSAVLQDRWDRYFRLKLTVAEGAPPRISAMGAEPLEPPNDAPPARMDWPQLREALAAKLVNNVAQGWFSGALVVSRNGETLFQAVHGLADREAAVPNTLETRFRMGSMNKMLTGVSALQLVAAGAMRLDDPVGRHLPDYPSHAFAETVTVGHLLNHTGGAGDFFGPAFSEHRLQLADIKDYVALLGARDPEFEPGSQFRYANYGFIVLGAVIEAASGSAYDDYVAANILGPAGMTATGALPESVEVPGRAIGYMEGRDGLVRSDPTLPVRGTPAGGGYSTVGDLVRFAEALTSGRLLDAERLALVIEGGIEAGPGATYGMGFGKGAYDGSRWCGHHGGAPGQNGALTIFPDTGYVIAALSNGDPPQASSLSNFIQARVPLAG
jgi:CubicO group peptidase (beta-lactamase class C family)